MVAGEIVQEDELVMYWEVGEEGDVVLNSTKDRSWEVPNGGLKEETGINEDEDEDVWRKGRCGGSEMGEGEGRAERAGDVLG